MRLNLKYPPTAANAPRFAGDIAAAAREISGADLDYSVASLDDVDRILDEMRGDGVAAEAVAETLFGFAMYVGEVLVRQAGGRWVDGDEGQRAALGEALVVKLPGGSFWNPIGKVFKRLENGPVDSLAHFYKVATGR